MKHHNLTKFVFLFLIVIQGCTDLQPHIYSNSTSGNAYSTKSDIESALTGVYSRLDPYPGDSYKYYASYLVMLTSFASDMGHSPAAGAPTQMTNSTYNSNNLYITENWRDMYQVVSNANRLLDNINNVQYQDNTTKKRIIGQARFLRALAYRDLTTSWGPVPLITKPTTPSKTRNMSLSSVEEVDSLIIKDCEYAIANLPAQWNNGSDISRATKGAALTLLGKVYIRAHEYKKAKKYIDQVLDLRNQGVYTLNPDFKEVWAGTNKADEGMIFGILHNAANGNGAEIKNEYGPADNKEVGSTFDYYGVTLYFWRKYSKKDPRRKFFWYNYAGATPRDPSTEYGFYYKLPARGENTPPNDTTKLLNDLATKKYTYKLTTNTYFDSRTIEVFRLSDVILLKAEIENALNGPGAALPYVNQVRERAGAPLYGHGNSDFPQPGSKEKMNDVILAERGFELVFEYHRRPDLVRFGKFVEYTNNYLKSRGISNRVNKNMIYFPYPQADAKQNSEMQQANSSRIP